MSNVSNESTFIVRFIAIHFYFIDIILYDNNRFHFNFFFVFRRKLKLHDVNKLQIYETHHIDIRKIHMIRNIIKTRII